MTAARTSLIHAGLAGKRVLVVDDDERIRAGMHAVLSRHGLQVDAAASAEEAYALAFKRGHEPDVMVTDYYLHSGNPGAENGVDLALRLRASGFASLPVLIVTADPAAGQLPQVRQCNFTVLYKPVKAEKMLRFLRDVLSA